MRACRPCLASALPAPFKRTCCVRLSKTRWPGAQEPIPERGAANMVASTGAWTTRCGRCRGRDTAAARSPGPCFLPYSGAPRAGWSPARLDSVFKTGTRNTGCIRSFARRRLCAAVAVCQTRPAGTHAETTHDQPCSSRHRQVPGASYLHGCMQDAVGPLCMIICLQLPGSLCGEDARASASAVSSCTTSGSCIAWHISMRSGATHACTSARSPTACAPCQQPAICACRASSTALAL